MSEKWLGTGKIIRDAVHGDIFIPNRFLEVIDTPEFQRLRRIKQLSIANMVFPSADHTRFSHSIGTFYIMNLMVAHFRESFSQIGVNISEEEVNIVLLASLLHDLGHGPFSHAFEGVLPQIHNNIKHEEWTKRIIGNEKGYIYTTIAKNFGEGIPEKVIELISKQREAKKKEDYVLEKIDLFNVLSSLISSQLDADRMDYLLRDSMHCGVAFGKIDIQRIISSLEITVQDNKYYVCVPEKYVQDIENYVLARYQMQRVVYYHEFKIQMEQMIKKILNRAYELNKKEELKECPGLIKKLFMGQMDVFEYVQMDDSLFEYAFSIWKNEEDEILKKLCGSLVWRKKSKKTHVFDDSDKYLNLFRKDVVCLFDKYNYKINDLKKEYFWIETKPQYSAYKKSKENIWILQSNGIIKDLSQVSVIFNSSEDAIVWKDDKNIVFINYNVLCQLGINNIEGLIQDLQKTISHYDLKNTVEIEKKYILESDEVFERVDQFMENESGYEIERQEIKEQIDYYYDTDELDLKNNNCTLRIREIKGEYEITIKKPVSRNVNDVTGQNERFEFKTKIKNKDDLNKEFISEHLEEYADKNFLPILVVQNNRTPIIMKKKDIKFEMVYDRVKYGKNNQEDMVSDFQIEIELKSQYQHRVNLKMLTDGIERVVKGLTVSKISKYKRGIELINTRSN